MAILDLLALLISLTALFSWFNHRFLKLPTTIGVMVMGMTLSAVAMLFVTWSTLRRNIKFRRRHHGPLPG